MSLTLHGYRYSVYARIVRMICAEKAIGYRWVEVNPFALDLPDSYLALHPFRRVPVLEHDGFVIYETVAISRYLDEAFPGISLQPSAPRDRARLAQIIAIIDAYGYWPMVRQVFAHRVFRPYLGEPADEEQVDAGIAAARKVLAALEALAGDDGYLAGDRLSLADLHAAPMVAYFTMAAEGQAALSAYPRLTAWWGNMSRRPSLTDTDPFA
ncbi:glutathione S-transferase family protein [Oceanibaculum indicum]|uniref:glutathione transferase n=1 Tax=Oceanibaculum indicum P24 TaxID=1207063 RepID=K2KDA4_9PROT|nr:glutathione S-transferase family protein [Oceanibaculum indicum]EKE75275.1 glutathione S-transferase [Oceanibaculum indicum P24]